EHPITERVVGVDLVKEQINIANGFELELKQDELHQHGHAIECRIYAEDPENDFMPSPGVIRHITEPLGLGVRHDGYVYEGFEIPIYYDPLISKLVVWARTREEAIARMKRALYAYKITGVKTSIPFLNRIMETADFVKGKYNTNFIEKNSDFLMFPDKHEVKVEDVAIIAAYVDYLDRLNDLQEDVHSKNGKNNWKNCGRRLSFNRF
ncbi:MAG: acetyl-CoA carboxylase biotin carboxylase subunit, partial [Bacteroidales bacterium]|nr:acetyl-CoA carboxylase biotin carboxylase subunit [Bacteroidales bacterium]